MASAKRLSLAVMLVMVLPASLQAAGTGKHLFILSGQSNMARLDPAASFTPTVEAAFDKDNVIVVKDAQGTQPIRRWYKAWKPAEGDEPKATGDLYDRMMKQVLPAIEGQKLASVTFVWMQGERDAKEKHGTVYGAALKGLIDQLSGDLKRNDVNFVIGRINDYSMDNESHPHWTIVREAQVQAAKELPRTEWVDTDDLNNPNCDAIHVTKEGSVTLGKRFAEKSIELINGQ